LGEGANENDLLTDTATRESTYTRTILNLSHGTSVALDALMIVSDCMELTGKGLRIATGMSGYGYRQNCAAFVRQVYQNGYCEKKGQDTMDLIMGASS
jgi:hypothetical protein